MAFWRLHRGKHVVVYTCEGGKQRQLPRSLTKQLDGLDHDAIVAWVSAWERENEKRAPAPESSPALDALLADFLAYAKSAGKNAGTTTGYRVALTRYVFPFFLERELRDPHAWPSASVKMLEALRAKGVSDASILKCNSSLSRFWAWLQDEQLVPAHLVLRLRKPRGEMDETPLSFTLTPNDVLRFARTLKRDDIELALLLGYFFSLRTQEIFVLQRGDFLAGDAAARLECTRVLANAGLFPRLALNVTRQLSKNSCRMERPKSGSKGWVACFHAEAAKRIVELVNARTRERDDRLFAHGTDFYIKAWRTHGLANVTLKDLRRASLYWLGHDSPLDVVALKNHARHALLSTTSLYVRRPGEVVDDGGFDLAL
jgi:hypothetical protein